MFIRAGALEKMFYPLGPHTSQRINSDNNHVLDIQAANPSLTLFYPYQEFKDRIHDPYFYPSIARMPPTNIS